jgi:predicted O-linked N-acetylglucosamine transferase (SPINDLY family)
LNPADPERRLRIAYLSPDFREHPVARFALPLFSEHDRRQVRVFAYSDAGKPDQVTELLRAQVDEWRDTHALNDTELADSVRADGIDILVDLAAHSAGNRLLVFAERPAPVQVTYLAYCSTTGVDAIDYRLTDRWLDPPGQVAPHYAERSVYLPDCYWCYSAPALPPDQLPSVDRNPGGPTFGCLNNFAKISKPTLAIWMRLLERVPEARLLLYARGDRHRERVLDFLRQADLPAARVAFVGHQPLADYLQTYREIDVALDPFPYTGGTTTCDALWMGVPVISLAGRTAVSRSGSTLLSNAGLQDLVATSEAQYVDLAAELLRDESRLSTLRRSLRPQLESSPIMDAPRFAHGMDAAFRDMWRRWCATQPRAD